VAEGRVTVKVWVAGLLLVATVLGVPRMTEPQATQKVARIGFLGSLSSYWRGGWYLTVTGLLGLRGYELGRNLAVETRYAIRSNDELSALVAELVGLNVDLIVTDSIPAVRAAMHATRPIPIVAVLDRDPVTAGVAQSLSRPGGNVTGVVALTPELTVKRAQLLKELVPRLRRMCILWNPDNPEREDDWRALRAAAETLALELRPVPFRVGDDVVSAFKAAVDARCSGMLMLEESYFTPPNIGAAARIHRMPVMGSEPEYVRRGGLVAYGWSQIDLAGRLAEQIARILKAAGAGSLPIEQPTRFELAINRTTAKELGLTIPPSILARADIIVD
jgi:putative ABC transport system substrate-binding protein